MNLELNDRVARVQASLYAASYERWGRVPQLIAVSKNVQADRVNEILGCGIARLGENRVQEIIEKMPYLNASFQIDLIGRLQSNKVKYIIDKVNMIQSLDRKSLAQEIDSRAQQRHIVMPVLIQVNIGRESQKGGVDVSELFDFVRYASSLPGIDVRGLMAIMPDIDDRQLLRPFFTRMRQLFDQLRGEGIANVSMEELSMGMSGDYELAAEEGATMVRVGSAIFGSRNG